MRSLNKWNILALSDTRISRGEQITTIQKRLKACKGVWSLGTPHYGGTTILFFQPTIILYSYHDPAEQFSRVDYTWKRNFHMYCSVCSY